MIFQDEQMKKKCIIAAVTRSFSPSFLGSILTCSNRVDSFDHAAVAKQFTHLLSPRLPNRTVLSPDATLYHTIRFSSCALNSVTTALRRENTFGIF